MLANQGGVGSKEDGKEERENQMAHGRLLWSIEINTMQ